MSAPQGGFRRPRQAVPRRSFKPEFDLLETRALPSGLCTGSGLSSVPPGGSSLGTPGAPANAPAVAVSTQLLNVAPGGDRATFDVALCAQPTADVAVGLTQFNPPTVAAGQTLLTLSPDHLTFTAANWSQPQTVTVSAAAAAGAQPAWVVGSTTSDDPNYDALAVPPVTVTVQNPSPQGAGLFFSNKELTVTPGGRGDSYTVALATKPTAPVTITIAEDDTLAPAPGHLTVTPATLTFTPDDWNTPQTVTVAAPASAASARPEVLLLRHTVQSSDPNYNGLHSPPVIVHEQGVAHSPVRLVVGSQGLAVVRGGGPITFGIVLPYRPLGPVTVTITEGGPDGGALPEPPGGPGTGGGQTGSTAGSSVPLTITPSTVTFTPDNWNTPQTIGVSAPPGPDGISTPGGEGWLNFALSSPDPFYNAGFVPVLPVVILPGAIDPPPPPPVVILPPAVPPVVVMPPPGPVGGPYVLPAPTPPKPGSGGHHKPAGDGGGGGPVHHKPVGHRTRLRKGPRHTSV